MAKIKNQTTVLENTIATAKTKVQDLNKEILLASEELIEGSVATGAQWQDIMAKALKNGTTLFGKQQEMTLDTVEALIGQYQTGNKRVRQLLGINGFSLRGTAQKAKAVAVKAKDRTVASVEELVGDVFETKPTVAKKKTQKVNKKAARVTNTSPKAAIKTTAAIDALFEKSPATTKTTKAAPTKKASSKAKVSSKAKATSRVKVAKAKKSATNARVKKTNTVAKKSVIKAGKKEDLTIIEGIGPKIEEVLNAAGILTFQALATTDIQVLKTILEAAGSRFKLHDPTTWGQQAELAAAGKWEVLKVWKNRLKGGKTANQISRIVVL